MIVLDEQLMGRGIETAIQHWYPGQVRFINALRPNTVIKDDEIPTLLTAQNMPTFITINVKDFWRMLPIQPGYCIIGFDLTDARAQEIPDLLRSLLKQDVFSTKAKRMGKMVRYLKHEIQYYAAKDSQLQSISLPA